MAALSQSRYETFVDPVDGTRWSVDIDFMASNWTCIWNDGCAGIGRDPAPDLQLGCCSVGAQMLDADEALRIGALGLSLQPARFEHHAEAARHGVFADDTRSNTRVVDGACIFLNRPGFAGGEGCALHLAAHDEGDSPIDSKPAICWQAPLLVDVDADGDRTLRPWTPDDWDGGRSEMGWCCTERQGSGQPDAYVGDKPVAVALHDELIGIVGPEVAVTLRDRFSR